MVNLERMRRDLQSAPAITAEQAATLVVALRRRFREAETKAKAATRLRRRMTCAGHGKADLVFARVLGRVSPLYDPPEPVRRELRPVTVLALLGL